MVSDNNTNSSARPTLPATLDDTAGRVGHRRDKFGQALSVKAQLPLARGSEFGGDCI